MISVIQTNITVKKTPKGQYCTNTKKALISQTQGYGCLSLIDDSFILL